MPDKLQKLKDVLGILNTDTVTVAQFNEAVKVLVNVVNKSKAKSEQISEELKALILETVNKIEQKQELLLNKTENITLEKISKSEKTLLSKIKQLEKVVEELKAIEIHDGKDGENGKDADEKAIVEKVEKDLEEDLPKFGIQFRDGLEMLKNGEKLSIQAIENLSDILEELRKLIGNKGRGGGGLSSMALNSKFIDDETPTGTINGSNAVFSLANSPVTGSVKVYVNGSRMRVTEDYTLVGRTITFTIAPPLTSIILIDYRVI